MKMLNSNAGEESIFIPVEDIYVSITDYRTISILREIETVLIQPQWCWIDLKDNKKINIKDTMENAQSFSYAINRAINDPYRTVYQFDSIPQMISSWDDIKYVDNIKTVYRTAEKEEN